MARVRRRGHGRKCELAEPEFWELLLGPGSVSAFTTESDRRAAWFAHRDALLDAVNPGTRPQGWWDYESPGPRLRDEPEADALFRLACLSPEEEAQRAEWARRRTG